MGKTSSKSKHQSKKTTQGRGDRRARRRAERDMLEHIKNGTELNERENMSTKTTDIIELTVLVAEEDYKHDLSMWDNLTKDQQNECFRDAYTPSKDDEYASLIHIQRWLIRKDENIQHCLQASLNEMVKRTWRVVKTGKVIG